MRNTKKWLASILIMAIAFGDCGGLTASATESTITAENAVSENSTSSDETPNTENTDKTDDKDTDSKTKLPTLHIGQIVSSEKLPAANDDFLYDLPLSFETEESLILFTNYVIDAIPDTEKTNKPEWSILRGEKGLEPGNTNLLDADDDWNGFETVTASPYFTMEEITDTGSEYDQMIMLTAKDSSFVTDDNADSDIEKAPETYDYYIRAAYYPETENGKAETFYTAVTIPFIPKNNTIKDADQTSEDTSDAPDTSKDFSQEPSAVSENDLKAAIDTVSENTMENAVDTVSGNSPEGAASVSENDVNEASSESDSEDAEADSAEEVPSTLSENNSSVAAVSPDDAEPSAIDIQSLSENNAQEPPLLPETEGKLFLYQGSAVSGNSIDSKERIPMESGDTLQFTAEMEPAMPEADILWESSDETVATVSAGTNGSVTVTAIAEGYAKIIASCHGITAFATVDVVTDKTNPDSDKLLDLSNEIRVAGFVKESDDLVYNGQKITQDLRVYHNNTLLKEKTDYTLSYKNNVNAAAWNSSKAPNVTIKLKGQYQGSVTLYYTIKPLDINEIDIYNTPKVSPAYEQAVNYSKTLKIPTPVLTFGKKKLTVKKDFICDYTTPGENLTALPSDPKNGELYEIGKKDKPYSYTVRGAGNFTGSFPMTLVVLKDKTLNFSSASVKMDKKKYEYHGMPLTKSDIQITEVKIGGKVLDAAQYDYEIYAPGIEGAYVMLSPTDAGKAAGYCGCKKITLKLVGDRQLKDAVPGTDWKESIPFSQKTVEKEGGLFQKGTALLAFDEAGKKKPLLEGTDYTVKYGNAKKAGSVTVTFTGKGRYQGTLRLTYAITPNTNVKIYAGKNVTSKNGTYEVAYQKDGTVPELILKDQEDSILKPKTDYTVKYKDNKAPGTMTCEITGKGNYRGYAKTVSLTVTKADISRCTISIPDKPYSNKPNKWQSTVTIKDVNGKKLKAGKDYDKNFTYSYNQPASPQAGTEITVTVKGLGFYENEEKPLTGTYRIFAKNISTLKVVIDPQEYTGEEITLMPNNIHVYASNADKRNDNELREASYQIVGYQNNTKAGTGKVTLRGIGNYGGTKTYSFKIQKKKYQINHIRGIKLDKNKLSSPLAEQDEQKRTLTATITAETDDPIANPTVIWSSSNSNVVSIETEPEISKSIVGGKATVSSTVLLTLKKEGSVTITATAQDGGKKAQCKVTVVDAPVLKEADQTVKANIGQTFQLHIDFAATQTPDKLKLESNNPDAISVAKNGEGALLTMKKAGAAVIKAVYTSGKHSFTQQCYAVAIDPNEKAPEGEVLTYEQEPGCTNDTPHINALLRDWERHPDRYEAFYIPAGVYHIDTVGGGFGGIVLTSNQKLIMSSSTLLMAIGNNQENSRVIWAFGRKNITISGGQIIGERKIHKGTNGEWGHGIQISGCTNVTIENVDISQCWGDGIYLGIYENAEQGNPISRDVTITNCNLHHNRRNNLSITDASNVTVKNCSFKYANGTNPQYGIDIEPNQGKTCSNVTISNSTFQGNAGGTIQILGQLNAHVRDVTIENCTGDKKPVQWSGFGGSVSGVTERGNKWG